MKEKKDRKMQAMKLVGKHNFDMENFLASDEEDSEKKKFESIIDH